MRNLIAAWYKSTEDLLNYCEPLLVYGNAKDSAQLAFLRGMNNAVHFLEGRVVHDDQNSVALAEECNHQKEQEAKGLHDQSWRKRLAVMEFQEQKKLKNSLKDDAMGPETEKVIYQEGIGFNLDCISTRLLHLAQASPPELPSEVEFMPNGKHTLKTYLGELVVNRCHELTNTVRQSSFLRYSTFQYRITYMSVYKRHTCKASHREASARLPEQKVTKRPSMAEILSTEVRHTAYEITQIRTKMVNLKPLKYVKSNHIQGNSLGWSFGVEAGLPGPIFTTYGLGKTKTKDQPGSQPYTTTVWMSGIVVMSKPFSLQDHLLR
ncbi:hypothetical protein EDB19DRAFT_1991218 [Suillus lakei]|nr:hypothetical protein EDB19DRAFT_1991218 [Suillus lakei]